MASRNGNPEGFRIMLVGASGSGKSATGNTILGKRAFTIRQPWESETLTCQAERGEFEGTPVSVVDTPGTMRPNTIEMSNFMSYCLPGPHAFLLVIPLKRVTDVERQVNSLQRMFGEVGSRYTIVLFTHGDELPDGLTAEEFIQQNSLPYGVGYHVFNNRDEDPSQVRELLEKINRMVQRNGGSYSIKVKDWKQMCLYLCASAVTIGGSIGSASGGTAGGVLVAFVGSIVGAVAAAVGGNRAVAGSIAVTAVGAVVNAVVVYIAVALAVGADPAVQAAVILVYIVGQHGVLFVSVIVTLAVALPGSRSKDEYSASVVSVYAAVVVTAGVAGVGARTAAIGLAVALRAGVIDGVVIAAKAAAAIAAGARTAGAAFEVIDDRDVHFEAIWGIIGGAGVGAGVCAAVSVAADVEDEIAVHIDLFCAGFSASLGVLIVLFVLYFWLCFKVPSAINKTVTVAIFAGVSVGAAFGAAVGVGLLGASSFVAVTMIYIACQAVAWWLNRKG